MVLVERYLIRQQMSRIDELREIITQLRADNYDLKNKLQAYKDKEKKLRAELENFHTQFEIDETISVHHLKSKKEILEIVRQQIKNCLQILNEGTNENN